MKKPCLFLLVFFLSAGVACSSQTSLSGIDLDSCFMSYNDTSELQTELEKLNKELEVDNPSPSFMTVLGCINYQMGDVKLSKKLLQEAFEMAKKDFVKSTAGSALSLIYLKELKLANIKPYLEFANESFLGKWMLVLYHIEQYRETQYTEHLSSAIAVMKEKQTAEGFTSATKRFLAHMEFIYQQATVCNIDENSPNCSIDDLKDEQFYLFGSSRGYLDILLKIPPYNKNLIPVESLASIGLGNFLN